VSVEIGGIAFDLAGKDLRLPQEHPGIPEIVAGIAEFLRGSRIRLFLEFLDSIKRCPSPEDLRGSPREPDVSVAGGREGRRDPEGDQTVIRRGRLCAGPEAFPKLVRIPDGMIRRQNGQHGFRVLQIQDGRGQHQAGRRVAGLGLDEQVPGRSIRQIAAEDFCQFLVGDGVYLAGLQEGIKPAHRLLDHGLVARDGQELFGPLPPAQRPEPGPCPPRHNHSTQVHDILLFTGPGP
jgi:hypothetical protein